ncbi:hypothetical protein [Kitasatospora aburaviensis]|uniref:TrbL/VirB6 plasmid conjugal transfer protein n=1 Tax=Kitasatospora aburaviensis TaxID=67265 RepID=A0ABW1F2X2_9ACTN
MRTSDSGLRRAFVLLALLAAVLLPAASAIAAPKPIPVPGATAGTACPQGTWPQAGDPSGLAANGMKWPAELKDARGGCTPRSEQGCQALGQTGAALEKCVREVKEADCEDSALSWLPGSEDVCKDRVAEEMKERCKKAGSTHCDDAGGLAAALKDPISSAASAGFDSVSRKFAGAAKWLAEQIGKVLFDASAIDLDSDGVADLNGTMMRLSLTIAVILLCLQVTKTALTSDGGGFAVAAMGLVKWSLTSVAFYTVTQEAIWASDEISRWLVRTSSYENEAGFTLKLTAVFASLDGVTDTVLVFLVAFAACVVALALWLEMVFRHAALDILVATAPMSAVGALSESTKEWMPTARKATITLIAIKPVIVIIFLLGSQMFGQSKDLNGAVVGVLIIGLGGAAWPVVARFMPFGGSGTGGSFMGGLLGAVGGTAASAMWSRGGGTPSGAGAVPPGAGLAQAMESNDSAGRTRAETRSGSGRGVMAGLMAAQLAKAGTEQVSGGMAAMAAHAGLGSPQDMGGTISLPPSRGSSAPGGEAVGPADTTAAGGQGSGGTGGPRPAAPPAPAIPVAAPSAPGRPRTAPAGGQPGVRLGPVIPAGGRPVPATPAPGAASPPAVSMPTAPSAVPTVPVTPAPAQPAPVPLPDEPPIRGADSS